MESIDCTRRPWSGGRTLGGLLTLLLALSVPGLASAATFVVNEPLDAAKIPGSGCSCVSTLGERCTIRAAIQTANACPGPDVVHVPPGTYQLTIVGLEDAGVAGDLDVRGETLTILATDATIDGTGLDDRILHEVLDEGQELVVIGLEMRNTNMNQNGGCMLSDGQGTVILEGARFDHCETIEGRGGGLYAGAEVRSLILVGTDFQYCRAGNRAGGAGVAAQRLLVEGGTYLVNSSGSRGGGMWIGRSGAPVVAELYSVSFFANTSRTRGGGLDVGNVDLTLVQGVFTDNIADETGGAVRLGGNASGYITGSTIAGNVALDQGGGVFSVGSLTIEESIINGNMAFEEGGGAVLSGGSLRNSTIVGNTASGGPGGGIYVLSGTTQITHATVVDNLARNFSPLIVWNGAGVATSSFGSAQLANSIVAGRVPATVQCDGTVSSAGGNVTTHASCVTPLAAFDNVVSTLAAVGLAGGIADNGGPTGTMAILPLGAADGGANPALCLPRDQRGFPRSPPCDVGAFELP